jgi:hypothetical protein
MRRALGVYKLPRQPFFFSSLYYLLCMFTQICYRADPCVFVLLSKNPTTMAVCVCARLHTFKLQPKPDLEELMRLLCVFSFDRTSAPGIYPK